MNAWFNWEATWTWLLLKFCILSYFRKQILFFKFCWQLILFHIIHWNSNHLAHLHFLKKNPIGNSTLFCNNFCSYFLCTDNKYARDRQIHLMAKWWLFFTFWALLFSFPLVNLICTFNWALYLLFFSFHYKRETYITTSTKEYHPFVHRFKCHYYC